MSYFNFEMFTFYFPIIFFFIEYNFSCPMSYIYNDIFDDKLSKSIKVGKKYNFLLDIKSLIFHEMKYHNKLDHIIILLMR